MEIVEVLFYWTEVVNDRDCGGYLIVGGTPEKIDNATAGLERIGERNVVGVESVKCFACCDAVNNQLVWRHGRGGREGFDKERWDDDKAIRRLKAIVVLRASVVRAFIPSISDSAIRESQAGT